MIGLTEARGTTLRLKNTFLFRQQAYVDGQWRDADNGAMIRVMNPATGALVGTVPRMGAAETRRAIEAAAKAVPAWRAKTAKERSAVLRRWYDLILAHRDDLALLMTTEQGKPLHEAKGEIVYGAAFLEWFSEEAKRVYGDVIPQRRDRRDADGEPPGPQDHVHGVHGCGPGPDAPERRDDQEDLAGAERQRRLHRLRRRRRGSGRRGGAGLQVPEHGPDLRVRQPDPGAGWDP